MDCNNLDKRFNDHIKSAHVVIPKMAPQNIENDMAFLNTKENNEHLSSLDETNHKTKLLVEKLYSKINWNGFSEKFIEHVKSACVVVDRLKCKQCDAVFYSMREYYFHLTSHVQRTDGDVSNDQFVKRYSCKKCDMKFVQKSTLDMHKVFHDPFPHNCECGIGFHLKSDLLLHKELVHPATFKEELDKLTCRKRRALENEYWGTAVDHRGPRTTEKEKKEERSPERSPPKGPRLQAELIPKSKTKSKSKSRRPWKIKAKKERHICDDCGKEFSQRGNLVTHAKTHAPPTVPCPTCHKLFKCAANLRLHRLTHTGERPHACHLCDKRFSQAGSLKLHLQRHAGVKEYACDVCGKEFHARNNMENHRRIHTGVKPYECSYCGRAFSDQSARQRHERTHSGVKPYACSYCGMRFSDASGRIVHERRHTAVREHRCRVCGKAFYTADYLRKHHLAVHTRRRDFRCDACSKTFALKSYLVLHITRSHSDAAATLRCDHCVYRFKHKADLIKHMRRHMKVPEKYRSDPVRLRTHRDAIHLDEDERGEAEERFSDETGGHAHGVTSPVNVERDDRSKRFRSRSDSEKHEAEGHVRCDISDVTLPSVDRLNSRRGIPYGAKHECQICWKKFKTVKRLNRHHREVHSEEENFECHHCGDKFATKSSVLKHIYKEHLVSMYCNVCKKVFYSDSELKRHKSKECKGRPPIPCQICDRVFASRPGMTSHLLVKHAKRYVECDHCRSRFGGKSGLIRHIRSRHRHVMKAQK